VDDWNICTLDPPEDALLELLLEPVELAEEPGGGGGVVPPELPPELRDELRLELWELSLEPTEDREEELTEEPTEPGVDDTPELFEEAIQADGKQAMSPGSHTLLIHSTSRHFFAQEPSPWSSQGPGHTGLQSLSVTHRGAEEDENELLLLLLLELLVDERLLESEDDDLLLNELRELDRTEPMELPEGVGGGGG